MSHALHDIVSLELSRSVAERLKLHPEWIEFARGNLARWSRLNHDAPGLMACYREWEKLLTRPVNEICEVLTATDDEGQRLRTNSPFAGVLSPKEVLEIKNTVRQRFEETELDPQMRDLCMGRLSRIQVADHL